LLVPFTKRCQDILSTRHSSVLVSFLSALLMREDKGMVSKISQHLSLSSTKELTLVLGYCEVLHSGSLKRYICPRQVPPCLSGQRISVEKGLDMNKLELAGQNLGWVFNCRLGRVFAPKNNFHNRKQPNLKKKTQPRQLIGYLQLVFTLLD
jgi:hypothetical protein